MYSNKNIKFVILLIVYNIHFVFLAEPILHPIADLACGYCLSGNYEAAMFFIPQGYNCTDLDKVMRMSGKVDGCLSKSTPTAAPSTQDSHNFANIEDAKNYAIEQQKQTKAAEKAKNIMYVAFGVSITIFFILFILSYFIYKHKMRVYTDLIDEKIHEISISRNNTSIVTDSRNYNPIIYPGKRNVTNLVPRKQ